MVAGPEEQGDERIYHLVAEFLGKVEHLEHRVDGNHSEDRFKLLDDGQCCPELLDVALKVGYERRWVDVRPEVLVFAKADSVGDVAEQRTRGGI